MTITLALRRFVQERADAACEYCGVTETDSGGELTIDHAQPLRHGGTDAPENLVYCCHRCNEYKGDYWPIGPEAVALWNPRHEPASRHFLLLSDGILAPLTDVGHLTIAVLRLNRPRLIAHRARQHAQRATDAQLATYRDLVAAIARLRQQQEGQSQQQQELFQAEQQLIEALLRLYERGT